MASVPIAYGVRMSLTRRLQSRSVAWIAVATVLPFSVIYTPVVYFASRIAARFDLMQYVPLLTVWQGTFLAAACAYTVRTIMIEAGGANPAKADPDTPRPPRLMSRIDCPPEAALMSISVRDHYVDVRTAAGQASVLMRLSDAIAETEGVDGAQVHRSHWVAWSAVRDVDRRGSNLVLRMVDGAEIPVSRNYREKLEERGLI